jgi:hypothetical protein
MQRQKVIVRKLDGQIIKGYVEGIPALQNTKDISVASITEEIITVPKQEVKALFFVRKFSGDKDYCEIKFFESQPKIEGLWIRLVFFDGEIIEGTITNSARFVVDDGFYLRPADPKSNNRLMYVLKTALKDFRLVGVVYPKGSPVKTGS